MQFLRAKEIVEHVAVKVNIFFSLEEVRCDESFFFLVLSLGEGVTDNHDLEMR